MYHPTQSWVDRALEMSGEVRIRNYELEELRRKAASYDEICKERRDYVVELGVDSVLVDGPGGRRRISYVSPEELKARR